MSEAIESVEEAVQEQERVPPAALKPGAAERALKESETLDIISWMRSLGPQGSFRVELYRVKPEVGVWKGQRIDIEGSCETYDGEITEEDIKADYGGGTYDLRVKKPNDKGSYVFFRSKRIKISGPPRMEKHAEHLPLPEAPTQGEGVALSQQAMTVMTKVLQEERDRKKEPAHHDTNVDAIAAATTPLLETIRELRADQREDRKALAAIHSAPPPPPVENQSVKTLERMLDNTDSRLDSLRIQFDSERNQLTTYWRGQVDRAEDSAKRQIDSLEKGHERELKGLEKAHDHAIDTLKTSYGMQIESLKREVARLERELGGKEKEIGELRAQKTKSLPEQISEINGLKDLMKGDDDDDEKGGSTTERVIYMVINSNPIAAIASRIAAAPQQQAPAATQQAPQDPFAHIPLGQPFNYNGKVMVRAQLPNGQIGVVPLRKKKPGAKPDGAPATPGVDAAEGDMPQIDASDLATAVTFIESAINSRTEPADFANTVKVMAPQLAGILRKHGADKLLAMAKLDDSSPILTQRGKSFVRAVAESLTAG